MKARMLLAVAAGSALAVAVAGPAHADALRNAPQAPSVVLPGAATLSAAHADPRTWIVGAHAGSATARRLARAHGARRIAPGAWLVERRRARSLSAALTGRGLIDYAEPNRVGRRAQTPAPAPPAPDPLSPLAGWREHVVAGQVPPPVTPESPLIAVVDTQIDATHPEIAGSGIVSSRGTAASDFHGTATTTVAAAPANGVGILGIWPGARVLNVALPDGDRITCADSARSIALAVRAGASVINMSYGSPQKCIAEDQQVQRAVRLGAVPVAASGNEYEQGNPLEYPASLAHVMTVGAIGPDDAPTSFSNESAAVDLAAPGIGILTAVPAGYDPDGTANGRGFAVVDGTSFSAPMVAAAVAWVRAARPDLTRGQASQVVRLGARDVGDPGYDRATGFGVLSLPGALAYATPPDDPQEPNDDIRYVNGRAFEMPSPALYGGRNSTRSLTATVDVAEDPVDVYRVRVRAGRSLRMTLRPSVGDPDLFMYGPRAKSVRRSRRLADSTRTGLRADRLTIRNRDDQTRTYYVAVAFSVRKARTMLNARYELRAG